MYNEKETQRQLDQGEITYEEYRNRLQAICDEITEETIDRLYYQYGEEETNNKK